MTLNPRCAQIINIAATVVSSIVLLFALTSFFHPFDVTTASDLAYLRTGPDFSSIVAVPPPPPPAPVGTSGSGGASNSTSTTETVAQKLDRLDMRLASLEKLLGDSPTKALQFTLLQKDFNNLKELQDKRFEYADNHVKAIEEQNTKIMGLTAFAVISIAISNVFGGKAKSEKED
jgi:hypothetical protein